MSFWKRLAVLNAPFLARSLRQLADELEALYPGSPLLAAVIFWTGGIPTMASIEVPDNSAPLNATVSFLDAEGAPTTADDVPRWSSDNETAAVVTAFEDGLSATVEIGAPGAAIISVDSTNDDGSTVHAQGTITVLPGDAGSR